MGDLITFKHFVALILVYVGLAIAYQNYMLTHAVVFLVAAAFFLYFLFPPVRDFLQQRKNPQASRWKYADFINR